MNILIRIPDELIASFCRGDDVLGELKSNLFGYSDALISWDDHSDQIIINASPEAIRSLYAFDLSDDEPMPPPQDISSYIVKEIAYRDDKQKEKERIKQLIA